MIWLYHEHFALIKAFRQNTCCIDCADHQYNFWFSSVLPSVSPIFHNKPKTPKFIFHFIFIYQVFQWVKINDFKVLLVFGSFSITVLCNYLQPFVVSLQKLFTFCTLLTFLYAFIPFSNILNYFVDFYAILPSNL